MEFIWVTVNCYIDRKPLDVEEIRRVYKNNNITIARTASRVGETSQTVSLVLSDRLKELNEQKILEMHDRETTIRQIADNLDLTRREVGVVLRKNLG